MGLFDNPRQNEAQPLRKKNLGAYDDLVNRITGGQSQFANVNGLQDITSKYGVKPFDTAGYKSAVQGAYAPAKRGLQTQLARDRSSLGSRLGASATPESVFSPLESRYSQAGANLAGQQGQQELAGFDKSNEQDLQRANLLERLLGKKEAFGQEQNNQIQGALGARGNAIGDYTDTLSGTSTFDDILSVLSTGADLAGEIAPFFKKNKLPTPKPNNTGTDMVSRTPV